MQRKQALCFRRECEPLRGLQQIEGLDTEAVPTDQEALPLLVPQGEGEHSVQPSDKRIPDLLVETEYYLAIGVTPEHVASLQELLAQLGGVVDFAVANEDKIPVARLQRLMAAFDVDDRQTASAERAVSVDGMPFAIRTAMMLNARHPSQVAAIGPAAVEVDDPIDTAHGRFLPLAPDDSPSSFGRTTPSTRTEAFAPPPGRRPDAVAMASKRVAAGSISIPASDDARHGKRITCHAKPSFRRASPCWSEGTASSR
jgi:hypothetical protein